VIRPEQSTRVAVLTALAAAIDAELTAAKQELSAGLAAAKQELGVSQVTATLPDGTPIAKVAWVTPAPAAMVADPVAFGEWVAREMPEQIERIERVRPAFERALLQEMTAAGVPRWCNPETGQLFDSVPGVRMQGRAAHQRLTWAKTGKQAVAAALHARELDHLWQAALEGGE
jgi:hypothetical protein